MKNPVILNSAGQPIVLNAREARVAAVNQKLVNALGYEVNITTLTSIVKKVSEQKFFEIPPADFLPIRVGEGAWSTSLTTFRSFQAGDDFETGIVNTGKENGRLAGVQAAVDSLNIKILNWAKQLGYTLFDLEFATKSGNWDLVSTLEKARKKNWDLGIQRVAFLGAKGNSAALGLLNQVGITKNTTLITKPISSMTPTEQSTLLQSLIELYRSNCARTAWPTHFIIPESDYNGMAAQSSPTYPVKSILQVLEEALQTITRNKGFKILPLAYCDKVYSGYTQQLYVLLNYDEESLRMDVPVQYTNTLANSTDNFSFQNVGYGQFTGALAYRPLEMMYFAY